MKVCAVIPVYNEAEHIREVVARCVAHADCLVVDDGSSDDTAARAEEAGARVVRREVNEGKGAALQVGFEIAEREGYDAVVTLDGDGQHDPDEIPRFLAAAASEPDCGMIIGCRMQDARAMPFVRRWTNRVMSAVISWLCGQKVLDTQCGYRLLRVSMLKQLRVTAAHYDIESEMLVQACRAGFRVKEIPIRAIYRGERSKIRVGRETFNFLKLVCRYALRRGGAA